MTRKPSGRAGTDRSASESAAVNNNNNENESSVTRIQETPRANPRLDPAAEARIGRKLKAMYDQVVNEPVPDHLLDLLGKLDASSKK
jgi:hypothetical protein